jgi:hypothetical protein
MSTAKQSARDLIEQLPDSVGWNELMRELRARQDLEQGLKALDDSEAKHRVTGLEEARQRVTQAGIAAMSMDEINSEIEADRSVRRAKPFQ